MVQCTTVEKVSLGRDIKGAMGEREALTEKKKKIFGEFQSVFFRTEHGGTKRESE